MTHPIKGSVLISRTRLFTALIVFAAGGFMSGALAEAINGPTPPPVYVQRIGTVQASPAPTAEAATVAIDEGVFTWPYHAGYVPVAGDKVNVLLLGGSGSTLSGIILGGRAGQAGNLIVNPNFYRAPALELLPVNNPPYHWTRYTASGNAGALCQVPHMSFQRLMMGMLAVDGASSGDTYAYSSAIKVTAGATYSWRSMGRATTNISTSLTVETLIAWFADATSEYPNYLSQNAIGSDAVGANTSVNIYHTANVAAPGGATYARMALRTNHVGSAVGAGSIMYWAEVVGLPA